MNCPRCGAAMQEERRSFHKKRKWNCPRCRKVRMQQAKPRSKGNRPDKESEE